MSEFGGKLDEHFDNIYRYNVLSMEHYEEKIGGLSHLLYINRDNSLVEDALSECDIFEWVRNSLVDESPDGWSELFTKFQNEVRSYCDKKAVELYKKYGDKAYDYV